MKIENDLLLSIENNFRGLRLHNQFKLIRTNLENKKATATFKHVDNTLGANITIEFAIPKYKFEGNVDIGSLVSMCREQEIHQEYEMHKLTILSETISAEFFNPEDFISIKVKTLR